MSNLTEIRKFFVKYGVRLGDIIKTAPDKLTKTVNTVTVGQDTTTSCIFRLPTFVVQLPREEHCPSHRTCKKRFVQWEMVEYHGFAEWKKFSLPENMHPCPDIFRGVS